MRWPAVLIVGFPMHSSGRPGADLPSSGRVVGDIPETTAKRVGCGGEIPLRRLVHRAEPD
jgi:hypothetical protein